MLIAITRKACLCKQSAEQLITSINELAPIIHEIKYTGVELNSVRQMQLETLSRALQDGHELAGKVLNSSRWNVYRNLQLSRKMEKVQKKISRFVQGPLQAHVLADVHHVRFETAERFDRLENSTRRIEHRLGSMKLGVSDEVYEDENMHKGNMVKVGMELSKRKVKDMLLDNDLIVVGINGIGGSGKTTLIRDICTDDEVRSKFYTYSFMFLSIFINLSL